MKQKWKSALSGAGFYAALAVCVLAVGIGGYFALLRPGGQETAEEPEISQPASGIPEGFVMEPERPAPAEEEPEPEEAPEETPVSAPVAMPEQEIDPAPVAPEAPRLIVAPLQGEILAAFSVDALVYNPTLEDWRTHEGVDIGADPGTTVLAACSGTVSAVEDDPMMGTTVVIDHDGGYQTTYANLQARPNVREGESVSAGQIIGAVGLTAAAESAQAAHLHFSVTKDGQIMDPDEFLER